MSPAFSVLQVLESQSFYLSYGSFASRFFSPAIVSLGSLSAYCPTVLSFSYSLLQQSHPLSPSLFITLPVVALSPSSFSVYLSSWFIVRLFSRLPASSNRPLLLLLCPCSFFVVSFRIRRQFFLLHLSRRSSFSLAFLR